MTSNRRDFKNSDNSNKPEKINKEFKSASRIVLGEYQQKNNSNYRSLYCNPKDQKSKFNYDKIEFKYDPYNVHPITSELVNRNKNNWGFEYYNKDKSKHAISNDKPGFVNDNFRRVYDPITNRYFNKG